MDTQGFKRLLSGVVVDVPGASEAGIKQVLGDAMFEFFEFTSSWMESIPFQTVVNSQAYAIAPTAGGNIVGLKTVLDANNIPLAASMPSIGTVQLAYIATTVKTLNAIVVKNLKRETPLDEQVPQFVVDLWWQVLKDGIQGKLMNQPGKTYSNDTLALYHLRRFNDGMSRARIATEMQNVQGANAWIYPQQFSTRGQRSSVSVGNANIL